MVYFFPPPPSYSRDPCDLSPAGRLLHGVFSSLPVDSGLLFPRLPSLVVVSRDSQQAAGAKRRALMSSHDYEGSALALPGRL